MRIISVPEQGPRLFSHRDVLVNKAQTFMDAPA